MEHKDQDSVPLAALWARGVSRSRLQMEEGLDTVSPHKSSDLYGCTGVRDVAMEHGDGNRLSADESSSVRKPWNAPVLNQVEVAGNTYGPTNNNTDDDGVHSPS